MSQTISHLLLWNEFFSALGSVEKTEDWSGQFVKRGQPLTCGWKNGVGVVYDERGRPWVKLMENDERIREFKRVFALEDAGYVPHSFDRHFLEVVLPTL